MCVLLAVVLATATYGWYLRHNTAKLYGIDLKTDGNFGIKVAIVPGGEDIMADRSLPRIEEDNKIITVIPINLSNFSNIEEGKIAPGAYGPLPFYITSLNESIKYYTIKIQLAYKPSKDGLSAAQIAMIETMIKDHFSVYQKKYEEDGIVKFSDPITYYLYEPDEVIGAEGELQFNVEVPVDLYWVWNYELTDIPDYQNLERFPTYGGSGNRGRDDPVVRQAVRQYDEEDTSLGNYLEDIWFNVYIEGDVSLKGVTK